MIIQNKHLMETLEILSSVYFLITLLFTLLFSISVLPQRPNQNEAACSTGSEFSYEDVCKPGITLLWDLVQEDKVVSGICILKTMQEWKQFMGCFTDLPWVELEKCLLAHLSL